ncbi:hypothetical protein [Gloeocapsopsis dulcis]|uniref:Uncharacterized protein n=1 Tax=Gloeocapsopsis dulcis AAB1 = 1H9 TaxID=1433147 RepID=A0A6N8FSB3_9CHRO|nr:hypothetical protein [Gloeocapsopsis dulcis]MUL35739.1 hypothetical protein [Gloeocapsopsis dulcis AAB1 = 1H9]WNN90978.1 hypothetical protein P0S91_07860 [Gloeocapsopsis dulcis]
MPLLNIDELKALVETPQSPCISLYMPMQKAGPDVRENPIRFKNLIREAEARLDAIEMPHTEAVELLKQAHELDTADFWENQDRGLVIFISPTVFRYYQLPIEFPELVVVSGQFHLKPLLQLINNDNRFYILALSQDNIRFFEGTPYNVKEVEVPNMPKSLDAALDYDETASSGQFRIATSRGGTANSMVQPGSFHGQGSPDRDEHQKDILQFFHQIDDVVCVKLKNQKAPLVLAGVEYLFPIYKDTNEYLHLVEEGINVNVDIVKPEELQDKALPIVEPLFHQAEKEAMERYQELAGAGTGKTSNDVKEIVSAAYFQRIDSLFVPVGQELWGQFDPDTMAVELHSEPEPDDEDMLDFAAVHTLLNGGMVYVVEPEEVPQSPAAAIFRY